MFNKRILKWTGISIIVLTLGYLTEDIVVTNVLGAYYCSQDPKAGSFIKQKVEYPESIYWEDNIYEGFGIVDSNMGLDDRKLMIFNFLDGKHLKRMALNGLDGKIYVYTAKEGDFDSFEFDKDRFRDRYHQYAHLIMKNEKVFTKDSMPQMNYTVAFNPVELKEFSSKYLYSDEVKIVDNRTKETIAYNRRYMRFFYKLMPDFAGGRYYAEQICGEAKFLRFDEKVFGLFSSMGPPKHYDLMDYFLKGKYQNKWSAK